MQRPYLWYEIKLKDKLNNNTTLLLLNVVRKKINETKELSINKIKQVIVTILCFVQFDDWKLKYNEPWWSVELLF